MFLLVNFYNYKLILITNVVLKFLFPKFNFYQIGKKYPIFSQVNFSKFFYAEN